MTKPAIHTAGFDLAAQVLLQRRISFDAISESDAESTAISFSSDSRNRRDKVQKFTLKRVLTVNPKVHVLAVLLLLMTVLSLAFDANVFASRANAHDFTTDEYCLRNVYANNDLGSQQTGIRCNSDNVWTLETAGGGLYCIRQRSNGKYLSNSPDMWSRCSTGEKWEVEIRTDRSGLICLKNDYTKKYVYVNSDGFQYTDRCSTAEFWRFQKVETPQRPAGFKLHATPHMVAFFDRPDATDESHIPEQDRKNCGRGWREVTEAKGFMLRGTTNPSEVGLRLGEQMSDDTAPRHFHDALLEVTFPARGLFAAGGPNTTPTSSRVWRRGVATTDAVRDGTAYRQMLVCEELEPKAADLVPTDTVAFFNGQECPGGWERYEPLNGRFAMPKPKDMTSGFDPAGRVVGDAASLLKGHDHVSGNSVSLNVRDFSLILAGWPETNHSLAGEDGKRGTAMLLDSIRSDGSGYSTILHPFITYLACKKTSGRPSIQALKVHAPKMTTFTTGPSCPNALDADSATWGRLLVGLPGEPFAKSGSTFGGNKLLEGLLNREIPQHNHDVTVSVYLGSQGVAGGNGCCLDGFAESGTATGQVTTPNRGASLAYTQLTFCSVPKKGPKPRR